MDKLTLLRNQMTAHGIDAYILPSGDPHSSPYMQEHFRVRPWFTGFTGSSGIVVITQTEAGLWTDGRYFVQAENQLNGTPFTLFKMGEPGVPTYEEYLQQKLPSGGAIGYDANTMSCWSYDKLTDKLGSTFRYVKTNFIDDIWANRPPLATQAAFEHPPQYAGLSASQKLENVRKKMLEENVGVYLVTNLADIAWLLNVRGHDVPCTPLLYAYAIITQETAYIFTDASKIEDFAGKLSAMGFTIDKYENVEAHLQSIADNGEIYFSAASTNATLANIAREKFVMSKTKNIIGFMRAAQTPEELVNIRNAQIKEGAALTKLIKWLLDTVKAGTAITEDNVATKLTSIRKQFDLYICDSFETVAAYGENAALPHYKHIGEGAAIHANGFFLLDSGGQYMDGTTDTTRTIALGEITKEMREGYTCVLQGHIALNRAVFLKGTTGHSLDMLARQPVLQLCKNYNHGTGHGIGYLLGVHDGPQNVSGHPVDTKLEIGMVISNEPGLYKPGHYGIRIENDLAVQAHCQNDAGTFYSFENLTFCPYDIAAMDVSRLTHVEKDYINAYHKQVQAKLAPYLDSEEVAWLAEYAQEIV